MLPKAATLFICAGLFRYIGSATSIAGLGTTNTLHALNEAMLLNFFIGLGKTCFTVCSEPTITSCLI